MKLAVAQLQEGTAADRVITADDYVIVLDGATSFDPDMPEAGTYVDVLGSELRERLSTSSRNLRAILAESIRATVDILALTSGRAPSSTVAIARQRDVAIDTLLLGDSYIVIGGTGRSHTVVTDDRMAQLDLDESREYLRRLRAGTGYDETHRRILQSLQRSQGRHRNQLGGYWIAEADPIAADHAFCSEHRVENVPWLALATDGAADCIAALDISWPQLARCDAVALAHLLAEGRRWEAESDPDGCLTPRAKRHDDKSLVIAVPS